jgi:hypothetical protein
VNGHSIVWSAATCQYPGAGVYVGSAPQWEHLVLARGLSHKQLRIFIGGRLTFEGERRPWPIYYYALRDPSAARVVPIRNGRLPSGFDAVELRFRVGGAGADSVVPPGPERLQSWAAETNDCPPAGFIVTIGLDITKESGFFCKSLDSHDLDWTELYSRIVRMGCHTAA